MRCPGMISSRTPVDWPPIAAITEYRRCVYRLISSTIAGLDNLALPALRGTLGWAVMLGCEHERIHIETSTVLIRELPLALVLKPAAWPAAYDAACAESSFTPENPMIQVDTRRVVVGKDESFPRTAGTWSTAVFPFRSRHFVLASTPSQMANILSLSKLVVIEIEASGMTKGGTGASFGTPSGLLSGFAMDLRA